MIFVLYRSIISFPFPVRFLPHCYPCGFIMTYGTDRTCHYKAGVCTFLKFFCTGKETGKGNENTAPQGQSLLIPAVTPLRKASPDSLSGDERYGIPFSSGYGQPLSMCRTALPVSLYRTGDGEKALYPPAGIFCPPLSSFFPCPDSPFPSFFRSAGEP